MYHFFFAAKPETRSGEEAAQRQPFSTTPSPYSLPCPEILSLTKLDRPRSCTTTRVFSSKSACSCFTCYGKVQCVMEATSGRFFVSLCQTRRVRSLQAVGAARNLQPLRISALIHFLPTHRKVDVSQPTRGIINMNYLLCLLLNALFLPEVLANGNISGSASPTNMSQPTGPVTTDAMCGPDHNNTICVLDGIAPCCRFDSLRTYTRTNQSMQEY
ncbi:hypothetical protein MPH_07210 [Macrophomina phaseolina MS6]|uniref:Uncharacterized protein n=1 Tax=Macrophomina phaseolina (strain MS6) TaxID=1126212 RepID=K2SG22_MACPH|nr:hypothetical protein MPH_07210 [Macrophomina phaseolina MS6]